ncbi:CrcB family protein [Bacillus sp. REN10]|uniref:fluoride efflux transporter FluC n=1 Tax=Bacillus sp. REN10 TaxID=2782541 RepID=UPI00193B8D17|nr:CrcB family protein [Bacillus sp. REN10]
MIEFVVIAIGGAIGAVCRYGVSQLVRNVNGPFPFGALFVNLAGSCLLGLTASFLMNDQLFFGTGVLGGFTTFSTFSTEAATLYEKSFRLFITYVLLTIIGSITLFGLAFSL